ncbi:MAG: hypothetical protein MJ187_01235 [Alphaproteobacteria bacterium]|nr:hypothetical protein [Alphaproteobacteria bacterium]
METLTNYQKVLIKEYLRCEKKLKQCSVGENMKLICLRDAMLLRLKATGYDVKNLEMYCEVKSGVENNIMNIVGKIAPKKL